MTQIIVAEVIKDTIITALKVSAPILITAIAIGLVISILQATTQIQEQTLTFVPKLIGAALVGILCGSWMGTQVVEYFQRIFEMIIRIST